MPYTSDLEHETDISVALFENAFEAIARVPIGHDDEAKIQYSVMAGLITLPEETYGEGAMEVSFEVVEISDASPIYYCDGRETKNFLVSEERRKVLDIVCLAVHTLVERRNPKLITMSTKYGPTPKQALMKYELVSKTIRQAGYVGGSADSYNDLDLWMFIRNA